MIPAPTPNFDFVFSSLLPREQDIGETPVYHTGSSLERRLQRRPLKFSDLRHRWRRALGCVRFPSNLRLQEYAPAGHAQPNALRIQPHEVGLLAPAARGQGTLCVGAYTNAGSASRAWTRTAGPTLWRPRLLEAGTQRSELNINPVAGTR